MTRVVVVGGGIGGMVAALRARALGADVTLVEARSELGGLASGLSIDGMTFDGGPYILLDRVRLAWALDQVGIDLGAVPMVELDPAYRMVMNQNSGASRSLTIGSDLDETVASIDAADPGTGEAYRRFANKAAVALEQLAPMLVRPHHVTEPFRTGAWRAAAWAGLSLNQVLRLHGLSGAAAHAVRIWTYIAGGDPQRAPGPLALVPALIHRDGAARPVAGIHSIITLVHEAMQDAGIEIVTRSPVASINHNPSGVTGITTTDGLTIDADVVISDIGGSAALLDLVDARPPLAIRLRMAGPLQSPGVTAYLRVKGQPASEINFQVRAATGPSTSRRPAAKQATAFIVAGDTDSGDVARPARIIAPLSHQAASDLGEVGQRRLIDSLVDADWWRDDIDSVEVAATRLVSDWGREFRLRDNAMNLVMARRQLLLGRLPHQIRHIPGLFLAGSWTHPGQWISFCSVSGVLAANRALEVHG